MTWKRWPGYPGPAPIFYRLYYDPVTGRALFYSMEDVPGTYIEIDQETYNLNKSRVRVVNGKIEEINVEVSEKLVPSDNGTACDPWSVAVEVDPNKSHKRWSLKVYEA